MGNIPHNGIQRVVVSQCHLLVPELKLLHGHGRNQCMQRFRMQPALFKKT